MSITESAKESAHFLFEITHPEEAEAFCELKDYLDGMYFG